MSKKDVKFTQESTYKTMMTYTCPKRGVVTEEVTVRKFAAQITPDLKSTDTAISDLLSLDTVEEID